jgi:TRAP-type C4-dicarboxylate transport system permease small subunit
MKWGGVNLKSFFDGVNSLIEYITFAMFAVLVAIGGLQVFNRFVISKPLTWSEEITKILFFYIVFLGASMALRKGAFAVVDIIYDHVPGKMRIVFDLFNNAMVLLFMLIFVKLGIQISVISSTQVTPALQMPQAVVYAAVPIGCFLLLITSLELLIGIIRKNFGNRN